MKVHSLTLAALLMAVVLIFLGIFTVPLTLSVPFAGAGFIVAVLALTEHLKL